MEFNMRIITRLLRELKLVLIPQLVFIELALSKSSLKSISNGTDRILVLALAIVVVFYWFLLFSLGRTGLQSLCVATLGSSFLTVILFMLWDKEQRSDKDLDLQMASLFLPNLFLGMALTLGNSMSTYSVEFTCSRWLVVAVVIAVIIAFLLALIAHTLEGNPVIARLAFTQPRHTIQSPGPLIVISYICCELFAIGQKGLVTDWKVVMCFFSR